MVSAGDPECESSILFLHGWPEDWSSMRQLMVHASRSAHAVAIDLPGIGGSPAARRAGTKSEIARSVLELAEKLELRNLTIVGHDVGGMVAFACLRAQRSPLQAVVIMSVVVPGLKPWEEVIRNPNIWHFGFHKVPDLPELLVTGKERPYFDFFFDAIAAHPERIEDDARERYVAAYARPDALQTGFDWYRRFAEDAKLNAATSEAIETPLLYLRGSREPGDIVDYAEGFRSAGARRLSTAVIADSGHFTPEEQPEAAWAEIERFLAGVPSVRRRA